MSAEISRIQADALKIDPGKVLAWLLALPFLVLGYSVRLVWVVIALALASAKAGWQTATAHLEQVQKRPGG
jgi:hypothetical protein